MPRRAGLGRQHRHAVVRGEGAELGVQVGIVPIGPRDGRLEIVDHQRLGNAAEVEEGVLEDANEVVGRLAQDRFAIRLAAVRQDNSQHVRLAPLAVFNQRRADAKVDLRFGAGAHSMRRKGSGRCASKSRT